MTLADRMKQDEKNENAQTRSKWFKFAEGKNRIRVLTEPEVIYEDYKLGICYHECKFKGSIKYMAYVYDYAAKAVVTMKIPYGIFQWIANQEEDEDWKFTGFPMPYDMTITAENAGTKEVKYSVTARPVREDMPVEVMVEVAKREPIAKVIEALKKFNEDKHHKDGTYDALHEEAEASAPVSGEAKVIQKQAGIKYPDEEINPEDIPF